MVPESGLLGFRKGPVDEELMAMLVVWPLLIGWVRWLLVAKGVLVGKLRRGQSIVGGAVEEMVDLVDSYFFVWKYRYGCPDWYVCSFISKRNSRQ